MITGDYFYNPGRPCNMTTSAPGECVSGLTVLVGIALLIIFSFGAVIVAKELRTRVKCAPQNLTTEKTKLLDLNNIV